MTVVNNTILDNLSFINMTERALLLHSYLYYELDAIKIPDYQFDQLMYRMVELKKWDEFKESEFYEEFKEFEGATGMDLDYDKHFCRKWAHIWGLDKDKMGGKKK